VAARVFANARRGHAREDATSQVPESAAPGADAELALLRLEHRAHFKAAFAQAVARLTPRERTVLRLHTLDGLSLARIGAMYQKDASTVSRWLEQTRVALRAGTREALARALKLPEADLDSVLNAADSQLTVSLAGLLQSAAP
jgi:RNA polymerase sigma-70 factor (ECF subfamily)